MDIFEKLQANTDKWREEGYPSEQFPAISEILSWNKNPDGSLRYLRDAQFRALEVYWYVRICLNTPSLLELYERFFPRKIDRLAALGVPEIKEIRTMLYEGEDPFAKIRDDVNFAKALQLDTLHESLNLDYPSYILALAMGAGKTVLIGAIIASEFSLSSEYPEGNFMKNALVFAPGTTIIEALREISEIPFAKILSPRFYRFFMANVKTVYTRSGEKGIAAQMGSTYNLIVTNTEKIALRKIIRRKNQPLFAFEERQKREELLANERLLVIASLPNLGIFSDEAHHTYGNKLGEELKRVRETINHLHFETNIVCVVNTTGTPYYKKQPLKDVIFWYSLQQGIQDNILKSLLGGIVAYSFKSTAPETVISDIIESFFAKYGNTRLANGAQSKIAFYFSTQEHLDLSQPIIEKALAQIGQPATTILVNTQVSSPKEIDEFNRLNDPTSGKRVILLVGKGTEGWNCPSLFATALVREVKNSNNFVLQAATRCLRQVPENEQNATIYLEEGNYHILDKELRETFDISLSRLDYLWQDTEKRVLEIKKSEYPHLEITRVVNKVVLEDGEHKNIELTLPDLENLEQRILKEKLELKESSGGKMLSPTGEASEIILVSDTYDLYNVAQRIAQNYHIEQLPLLKELKRLYPAGEMPKSHLSTLCQQVEKQTQRYRIIQERITEVLAIIKFYDEANQEVFDRNDDGVYCHTIRYKKGTFGDKNQLLVAETEFISSNPQRLGFHYTPYNFDSTPEKDFFVKMLAKLQTKTDEIADIYFTGGLNDTRKSDFYFQYKSTSGVYRNYFPDFVIVKKDGSFLIVEIKEAGGENNLEVLAKEKALRHLESIPENRFRYEIIYSNAPVAPDKFAKIDRWVG